MKIVKIILITVLVLVVFAVLIIASGGIYTFCCKPKASKPVEQFSRMSENVSYNGCSEKVPDLDSNTYGDIRLCTVTVDSVKYGFFISSKGGVGTLFPLLNTIKPRAKHGKAVRY